MSVPDEPRDTGGFEVVLRGGLDAGREARRAIAASTRTLARSREGRPVAARDRARHERRSPRRRGARPAGPVRLPAPERHRSASRSSTRGPDFDGTVTAHERRFERRLGPVPGRPHRRALGSRADAPAGTCVWFELPAARSPLSITRGNRMDSHPSSHNLAARMARWSSKHRKKAFWGWLAFVILAFAIGNAVGPNLISDVDNFNGESHDAEAALDRAGLRPQSEVVFIQSDKLTIKDPEFKAAVQDVTSHLPKVPYVENVKSPLLGESAVSEDGHAALVDFDVAGDSVEARDRIDPVLAAVAAAQKRHPDLAVEQFGSASANKAVNDTITDDLASAGMLSLPVTLILLTHHVRDARGGRGAAVDRAERRGGHPRPGEPAQPDPPDRQQPVRRHPADRARGGCRLLALLSEAGARGARRRAQRGAPRSRRRRPPPAAPS